MVMVDDLGYARGEKFGTTGLRRDFVPGEEIFV